MLIIILGVVLFRTSLAYVQTATPHIKDASVAYTRYNYLQITSRQKCKADEESTRVVPKVSYTT